MSEPDPDDFEHAEFSSASHETVLPRKEHTGASNVSQQQRDRQRDNLTDTSASVRRKAALAPDKDNERTNFIDQIERTATPELRAKSAPLVTPNDTDVLPDMTRDKPSESALLHGLPFTLQGLSSTNLVFTSDAALLLPPTLPLPIISLLHTLAEPSLLYRSLSNFVESRDEGLMAQSLRSAIGNELRKYLGLIATLEGEIRRAAASPQGASTHGNLLKPVVTLKRCAVWTRDATMGLRLMSLMAEESKSKIVSVVELINAYICKLRKGAN